MFAWILQIFEHILWLKIIAQNYNEVSILDNNTVRYKQHTQMR